MGLSEMKLGEMRLGEMLPNLRSRLKSTCRCQVKSSPVGCDQVDNRRLGVILASSRVNFLYLAIPRSINNNMLMTCTLTQTDRQTETNRVTVRKVFVLHFLRCRAKQPTVLSQTCCDRLTETTLHQLTPTPFLLLPSLFFKYSEHNVFTAKRG